MADKRHVESTLITLDMKWLIERGCLSPSCSHYSYFFFSHSFPFKFLVIVWQPSGTWCFLSYRTKQDISFTKKSLHQKTSVSTLLSSIRESNICKDCNLHSRKLDEGQTIWSNQKLESEMILKWCSEMNHPSAKCTTTHTQTLVINTDLSLALTAAGRL